MWTPPVEDGKHDVKQEPSRKDRTWWKRLWDWTEFGKKTGWQWLELLSALAIPVVLAIAGYYFNTQPRIALRVEQHLPVWRSVLMRRRRRCSPTTRRAPSAGSPRASPPSPPGGRAGPCPGSSKWCPWPRRRGCR